MTAGRAELLGDEEALLWATASLGEARRAGKRKPIALLEAVVAELAFDLGAGRFPPVGARAMRANSGRGAGASSVRQQLRKIPDRSASKPYRCRTAVLVGKVFPRR